MCYYEVQLCLIITQDWFSGNNALAFETTYDRHLWWSLFWIKTINGNKYYHYNLEMRIFIQKIDPLNKNFNFQIIILLYLFEFLRQFFFNIINSFFWANFLSEIIRPKELHTCKKKKKERKNQFIILTVLVLGKSDQCRYNMIEEWKQWESSYIKMAWMSNDLTCLRRCRDLKLIPADWSNERSINTRKVITIMERTGQDLFRENPL